MSKRTSSSNNNTAATTTATATPSSSSSSSTSTPNVFYVAFVAVFYMSMSVLLVVVNKSVLSFGAFPLFTTWLQCVITVICALIVNMLFQSETGFVKPLDMTFDSLFAVSKLTVIFVIMLCTNNLSLQLVDVSFYPVARSLSILFTLMIEYSRGKPASFLIFLSCVVVMAGFFVGAKGQIKFSPEGTLWGLISSLFVSFYGVMTKSTLEAVNKSSWRLMAFNNIIASVLLLPIVIVTGEMEGALQYSLWDNFELWKSMFFSGLAGFVLSLATFMLINTTTPLTHLISGTFKNAILEIVSIVALKEPVTSMGLFGIVLNMGGSAWYTVLRHFENQKKEK